MSGFGFYDLYGQGVVLAHAPVPMHALSAHSALELGPVVLVDSVGTVSFEPVVMASGPSHMDHCSGHESPPKSGP